MSLVESNSLRHRTMSDERPRDQSPHKQFFCHSRSRDQSPHRSDSYPNLQRDMKPLYPEKKNDRKMSDRPFHQSSDGSGTITKIKLTRQDLADAKILYKLEFLDYENNTTRRDLDKKPIDVKKRNDRPWIEITKSVKSNFKTPAQAISVPSHHESDQEFGDEEYDFTDIKNTRMKIRSPYIMNALRALITYHPTMDLQSETLTLEAPFEPLIQYWDELKAYKDNHPTYHDEEYRKDCNEHIDTVLEFTEKDLGISIDDEKALNNASVPKVTFINLWMLLRPGKIVFARINDQHVPAVIYSCTPVKTNSGSTSVYMLKLWNVRFDGEKFGRQELENVEYIDFFSGEKEIKDLSVYPVKYHPDTELKKASIERGKKIWALTTPVLKDYSGFTVDWPKSPVKGRVMIDYYGYYKWAADVSKPMFLDGDARLDKSCRCDACVSARKNKQPLRSKFSTWDRLDPKKTLNVDDEDFFLLCSRRVPCFVLQERRWRVLDIDGLSQPELKKNALDTLVLPSETKTMLRALTTSYTKNFEDFLAPNSSQLSSDLLKIVLLHGSPGVGKSRTAECVAEVTGRPLLALTCAEIGIEPEEVEENLNLWLPMGEAWGAIMLLDEADLYLEQRVRGLDSLRHNGMVSIFLRALEQYRGILFLTTNRVGSLDEGFSSRIHVALHLPPLTEEGRTQIWSNNFDTLQEDYPSGIKITEDARDYVVENSEVKAVKWNGRDIRNALQTAVSLAEYEQLEQKTKTVTITRKILREVVKMSSQFKDYLKSIENIDPSMKARKDGDRNDEHGLPLAERTKPRSSLLKAAK